MQLPPLDDATADGAIALGANLPSPLGTPRQTLVRAVKAIEKIVKVIEVSRFFSTPASPAGAGPDYVNAALTFESAASATAILMQLHRIEAEIGRVRNQRWGARSVDLDLLFLGDAVLPDRQTHDRWRGLSPGAQIGTVPDRLILPHPRLQDRGFVLVPLAEVAPDWVHPVLGLRVREMLAALPAKELAGMRVLT